MKYLGDNEPLTSRVDGIRRFYRPRIKFPETITERTSFTRGADRKTDAISDEGFRSFLTVGFSKDDDNNLHYQSPETARSRIAKSPGGWRRPDIGALER